MSGKAGGCCGFSCRVWQRLSRYVHGIRMNTTGMTGNQRHRGERGQSQGRTLEGVLGRSKRTRGTETTEPRETGRRGQNGRSGCLEVSNREMEWETRRTVRGAGEKLRQGEGTAGRAKSAPVTAEGPGLVRAGRWELGCHGDPTRGRVRPGWGRLGAPGASGAVLIQRHRSDRMRAINYCDKMQSWS